MLKGFTKNQGKISNSVQIGTFNDKFTSRLSCFFAPILLLIHERERERERDKESNFLKRSCREI
jgi:hypothetical protein